MSSRHPKTHTDCEAEPPRSDTAHAHRYVPSRSSAYGFSSATHATCAVCGFCVPLSLLKQAGIPLSSMADDYGPEPEA